MKRLRMLGEAVDDFEIVPRETLAKKVELIIGKPVSIKHAVGKTRDNDIDAAANKVLQAKAYNNKPQVLVVVAGKVNDWQFDVNVKDFWKFCEGEEIKSGNHTISLAEKASGR